MSQPKRVSPAEAQQLVEQGWTFLDVRSEPEFADEHPAGAFNVPLMHMGPTGMTPNPDFVAVVEASFAKDAQLVLGCRSGGRSLRALQMLQQRGYANLVDQRAGFEGARDAFGGNVEPGWKPAGLPTERGDGGERGYAALARALHGA